MVRALPPAGVPLPLGDLLSGLGAELRGGRRAEFRAALSAYFGVNHCSTVSSGRAALAVLLKALKQLRPGKDEVVLPAYTSFSVPSAVVKAGLKVALADIDPRTMSFDRQSLRTAVSGSTLCIVMCHLYGYPCDIAAVLETAATESVFVIDDAAQSMGARYRGRSTGTFGDAGIFSLSRGKNITTVEGGIIVTDSERIAGAVEGIVPDGAGWRDRVGLALKGALLGALSHPSLYWIPQGLPFLDIGASVFSTEFEIKDFTDMQALIGMRMLERLGKINEGRRAKARALRAGLDRFGALSFPEQIEGAEPVYLRLPVRCAGPRRPAPQLGIVKSYPSPLNEIKELRPFLAGSQDRFPGAAEFAAQALTLPTHGYVTERDIAAIISHFSNN